MRQIISDRGEGSLLVPPVLGKIGFAAGAGAYPFEHGGRERVESGFLGADHIDGNSFRLRQLPNIFGRDHAGIIGAIGKDYHHSSTRKLGRVSKGHQEGIVKRRIISVPQSP